MQALVLASSSEEVVGRQGRIQLIDSILKGELEAKRIGAVKAQLDTTDPKRESYMREEPSQSGDGQAASTHDTP